MNGKISETKTIGAFMLGALLIAAPLGHAQTPPKDLYPTMAPLAEYLIADRSAEIRLAQSAAPAAISDHAEVLVMGRHGYESAVQGSNGFVCLVERSWTGSFDDPEFWNPKVRGSICFNPAAARSVLPLAYKKTAMALSGLSRAQMVAGLREALRKKEIPVLEAGAMSYMMSGQSYLGDSIGHGPSHLMFFGPNRSDGAGWGENLPGSPIFLLPAPEGSPEPVRTYIIPMSTWSDGTPASKDEHKH